MRTPLRPLGLIRTFGIVATLAAVVAAASPVRSGCADYHPKFDKLAVHIAPGRLDSLTVLYWRRAAGDSVPTSKLPSRCHVRWEQVPPVQPEITLTPAVGLPLSRTRVYIGAMGTAVVGLQARITATVYYQ